MVKLRKPEVSDEAVGLYEDLLMLRQKYDTLSAARKNNEFYRGCVKLWQMMGIEKQEPIGASFWQSDIMEVETPAAPDWMQHNPLALEGWQKAWAARCQLEKRRRDLLIKTDLTEP